jgi:hypothetical protein
MISKDEIENIKKLLIITLDQLEADYQNQIFNNYTSWFTRYGIELTSIDDVLKFLLFHEGLHAGGIIAIRKIMTR